VSLQDLLAGKTDFHGLGLDWLMMKQRGYGSKLGEQMRVAHSTNGYIQ
jgi:hypothetical protein